MYKLAFTESDCVKGVSINLETIFQDLSPLVKKYAQDIQNFRNRYKRLEPNYMHFDCTYITDKDVRALIDDKQIGNKDNECNNCERNTSQNNKSANKSVSEQIDENESGQNNKNTSE